MSTQLARRRSAASSGKMPTTSVRGLTSLFSRSSGLVDQILRQWAWGKSAKAVISSRASRSIVATAGNCRSRVSATVPTASRTVSGVGWAKMVRIAAATISACPLLTRASTLRMKWGCKESSCWRVGARLRWSEGSQKRRRADESGRGGNGAVALLSQERADFAQCLSDGAAADLEQIGEGVMGAQAALVEHRGQYPFGVGDLLHEDAAAAAG